MLEVIEGKPPLPRWFPPYEHGLFATAPQLGWEATPRAGLERRVRTRPSSTTSRRCRTCRTSSPAGRTGSARWAPRSRRARSSPPSSATSSPPTSARSSSARRWAVIDAVGSGSPRPVGQGGVLGRRQPGRHRRPARRAGQLRGLRGDRQRDGRRRVHRVRRHHVHGRRRLPAVAVPLDRVVRPVPAVQDRVGRDHRPPRADRDRRRHRRRPRGSRHWLARVTDGNRCYLAVEEQLVVGSVLRAFPDEFAEHIELDRCPRPRRLPIPKLLDLADGEATYDETFWRKRPDWTYQPTSPILAEPATRRHRPRPVASKFLTGSCVGTDSVRDQASSPDSLALQRRGRSPLPPTHTESPTSTPRRPLAPRRRLPSSAASPTRPSGSRPAPASATVASASSGTDTSRCHRSGRTSHTHRLRDLLRCRNDRGTDERPRRRQG